MKLCSFEAERAPRFGFQLPNGLLVDLPATLRLPSLDAIRQRHSKELAQAGDLKSFLALGQPALEAAREVQEAITRLEQPAATFRPESVRFLPPIPNPGKIIAIGLNYKDHAAEQNAPLPAAPLIFAKFTTALLGHNDTIRLPEISQKVDVEAELCVVILKTGRGFSESDARSAIAGYTVGNDVSARDLQHSDRQWVRGKSCDTFAPCGPLLVTEDELGSPHDLKIELKLNGNVQQSSNTRELIFNCYTLVSYISQAITLCTGDLIYTGTPAGVGVFRNPPVFLKSGDLVEVSIEKIGTLRNPVA